MLGFQLDRKGGLGYTRRHKRAGGTALEHSTFVRGNIMGKTGALAIVTPTEFKERTALTLSSRSTSTLVLDKLYGEYHQTRGTAQAVALYAALTQYRDAHGRAWNKCERNTASGGLLEYLHNMLGPGGMSDVSALAHDKNAADQIRKFERSEEHTSELQSH